MFDGGCVIYCIYSITYLIKSGEYIIKERELASGRLRVLRANHLTDRERAFCMCRMKCEMTDRVQWC